LNVKKMILSSMLITNALTIFIIEAQLPPIAPIPGIKLGLANVVTLFAIYLLGYKEAAKIHILRIVLGSIFTGQTISFMYQRWYLLFACYDAMQKAHIKRFYLAGRYFFRNCPYCRTVGRGHAGVGHCQCFVLCTNCVSQQYCNRIFYWIMCSIFIEKA